MVQIKSYTKPPEAVKYTMEVIMTLMQEKTDWQSVKNALSNVQGFIDKLVGFDVEGTPEKVWKKTREKMNHELF